MSQVMDTSKTLRKVRLSSDEIAKALGAIEHLAMSEVDYQKILSLLISPPKPGKRLKNAAKILDLGLPIAPEVCILCRDRVVKNRHIMHVIDELGDLHVSVGEDGNFLIGGSASAEDLFWLRRILQLAYASVAEVAGYGEKMVGGKG